MELQQPTVADAVGTLEPLLFSEVHNLIEIQGSIKRNIAKGTTDPGVDCFDQYYGLVGLVQYA